MLEVAAKTWVESNAWRRFEMSSAESRKMVKGLRDDISKVTEQLL